MKQTNLISNEMKEQNRLLHKEDWSFGIGGKKIAPKLVSWIKEYNIKSILDYGCGKGTLKAQFFKKNPIYKEKIRWQNYDPGFEIYDNLPKPADLVIVRDVMEHIEEDKIDANLEYIHSLTKKLVWFMIPKDSSTKKLSDGRNAHITQEPAEWWIKKIETRFEIIQKVKPHHHFKSLCRPIGKE